MKMFSAVLAVILLAVGLNVAPVGATTPPTPQIEGGKHNGIGYSGDGYDKHHVVSAWALAAARELGIGLIVPSYGLGPAVNMPPSHHKITPTHGGSDIAQAAREQELEDIKAHGVLHAFDRARDRWFIIVAADPILKPDYDAYVRAYGEARAYLLEWLRSQGIDPPDESPTGLMRVNNNNNDSGDDCPDGLPPPCTDSGAGGVAANPHGVPVTPSNEVTASATGVSAAPGTLYDLVLADASQLSADSRCNHSPTIVSVVPVAVDAAGNLGPVNFVPTDISWESAGEYDTVVPSLGRALLCFRQQSNQGASTNPTTLRIWPEPPAIAPNIGPQDQSVTAPATVQWVVGVRLTATPRNLVFCYGDGSCAPAQSVPAGTGSVAYRFRHEFASIGTYQQRATISETGAFSVSRTSVANKAYMEDHGWEPCIYTTS